MSTAVCTNTAASISPPRSGNRPLKTRSCALRRSARDLVFKGVLPLLGALMLTAVFVQTAVDTLDPAYGSGSSVFGVGSVFVVGIGLLLLGAVLMLVWRARHPEFFRGQTLRVDTPSLVLDE